MGLDVYLEYRKDSIELDSKLYPEHMFKIGYFRSSYNDGGINSVLERMGVPTLYDIFPHSDKKYQFKPNWKESLKLVNEALVAFNHAANGFSGKYDCFDIGATNLFTGPSPVQDEKTALKIFKDELETNKSGFTNYSNRQGHFYGEAVTVRGFVPGVNCLGQPCVYVITERQKNEKGEDENLKWYREALEIVRETIEYVIAQKDPQNYSLSWSG